ncbi:MAG: hypothetical protein BWY87_00711 [Deltaproteobacteria bacterium ADurb.Bin510]|nr:MAG: hypothetical protein BWY87_00711 [Deltaproteobacteria bacterium ADurb.Bin510]
MDEGLEVVLFFSNANIAPVSEYDRRLDAVRQLAGAYGLELHCDEYRHADWLRAVDGLEGEPERGRRCHECFRFNLLRASAKAAELDIPAFTTSLTISPHKPSRTIFELAGDLPGFEPYDFKKADGFRQSLDISRELGLYRQNYCGCEFSFRPQIKS